MNTNIQTQKNFIVTRDGEVDKELSQIYKTSPILEVRKWTRLQAEMWWYDLWHGTNYRQIRNRLAAEKRNHRFEQRLGLQRLPK